MKWLDSITRHEFEQTLGDTGGQRSLACYQARKEWDRTIATEQQQQQKQKPYCNKFNKDFKNGPHQKESLNKQKRQTKFLLLGNLHSGTCLKLISQ